MEPNKLDFKKLATQYGEGCLDSILPYLQDMYKYYYSYKKFETTRRKGAVEKQLKLCV